jgi:protoheme IX farnesyltransferase
MLMILTSVVGMLLAVPGMVPLDVLILGNLGIALVAGSGAAVNHLIDRKVDSLMKRTHNRPLPQGRVEPLHAILFATAIGVVGMVILLFWVNPLCAWLTLASFVGYAFIYTGYLKRATPQNIVIGGLAGATPPLLGWTSVTNSIDPHGLLLVLIIYTWTPPHFWALAIHRRDDYAKAGIPMLPVTHGIEFTKTCILAYTVLLIITTILPWLVGMSGTIYVIGALILGAIFLKYALELKFADKPNQAIRTFGWSITYLMLLFLLMLVDHYFLYNPIGI